MKENFEDLRNIFGSVLGPTEADFQKERRYFYLRVKDIQQVHEEIDIRHHEMPEKQRQKEDQQKELFHQAKGNYKISLSMGLRVSSTKFNIDKERKLEKISKKRIKEEAHIFCYEGDEIMDLSITHSDHYHKADGCIDEYHREIIGKPVGFAKILLTPFIAMPETKHLIKANLILKSPGENRNSENSDRKIEHKIENKLAAVVILQLYFCLQFEAKMMICPVSADLTKNIASLGQMSIGMILQLNGQKQKSTIASRQGIHPIWQTYENEGEAIKIKQGDPIPNQFTFNLVSAGHKLNLKVVDYPIIGENATLIGESEIKLDSRNFYKTPGKFYPHRLECRSRKKRLQETGDISIKTKFLFDAKKMREEINGQESSQEQDIDIFHNI